MKLLALDGHDGSGKTTLAHSLSIAVGAVVVRPFGGAAGRALIAAYRSGSEARVLAIGREALIAAMMEHRDAERVVLDRGWLTVATLVPQAVFEARWGLWFPTVLLWCDERVTAARLAARHTDEPVVGSHAAFLQTYRDRFALRPGTILRTDLEDRTSCLRALVGAFETATPFDIDSRPAMPLSAAP